MNKNTNVLEKLQEVAVRETKRREQAVRYLEKIVEELAEPLSEILGSISYDSDGVGTEAIWVPKYDKEKEKYAYITDLYFRYGRHYGSNDTQYPGFYVNIEMPYWGEDLVDIKGKAFWEYIKQICDWIQNYLPEYIEKHDKSREQRIQYLQNIAEYMKKQS